MSNALNLHPSSEGRYFYPVKDKRTSKGWRVVKTKKAGYRTKRTADTMGSIFYSEDYNKWRNRPQEKL